MSGAGSGGGVAAVAGAAVGRAVVAAAGGAARCPDGSKSPTVAPRATTKRKAFSIAAELERKGEGRVSRILNPNCHPGLDPGSMNAVCECRQCPCSWVLTLRQAQDMFSSG